MIVRAYKTSRGKDPVKEFIDALPKEKRQEILRALELIQAFGLEAPGVSMRKIKGKLWELRISQSRIFYVLIDRDTMVLLSAYKKESKKAPEHDIQVAMKRMEEILE